MSDSGFKHSTGRVPRLYKEAARIVREVKEEGGSFKGLVFGSKHRSLVKSLYALVVETLRHGTQLDMLLRRTQLLQKEQRLDPWLARVLMTELLWRQRKLSGPAIPLKIVMSYEDELVAQLDAQPALLEKPENEVVRPRFVRVNTLKTTTSTIMNTFTANGWQEVFPSETDCTPTDAYTKFQEKVALLAFNEFIQDLHVPDLLIFPRNMEFYQYEEYHNGLLLLQDKASCMSAFLLAAHQGSTVLDMCAAPGMKTTHLAATINNEGTVYAIEKHQERFESLCKMVSNAGASCVKPLCGDAMQFTDSDLPNVNYIVVDPTCSGSGMVYRKEVFDDGDVPKSRLDKLSTFQCSLLRHAMTNFPHVRRIVYSTCSVHPEENEAVVDTVLKTCPPNFRPIHPVTGADWMTKGSSNFEFGMYGLYAQPNKDYTNGFFITVFERTDNEYSRAQSFLSNIISPLELVDVPEQKKKKKKSKKEHVSHEKNSTLDPAFERMKKAMLNLSEVQEEVELAQSKKRKRRKGDIKSIEESIKRESNCEEGENDEQTSLNSYSTEDKISKKKIRVLDNHSSESMYP